LGNVLVMCSFCIHSYLRRTLKPPSALRHSCQIQTRT
jgi:hypothetical protein